MFVCVFSGVFGCFLRVFFCVFVVLSLVVFRLFWGGSYGFSLTNLTFLVFWGDFVLFFTFWYCFQLLVLSPLKLNWPLWF